MGRTSKFSFPLPNQSRHEPRGRAQHENSPRNASDSAKADQLLGLDNTQQHYVYDIKTNCMSVAISDGSYDDMSEMNDSAGDGGEKSSCSKFGQSLHRKPTSKVLVKKQNRPTGTSSTSGKQSVKHQHSSSTLRSRYDAKRHPLLVSQQTSASSSRDMALRKGLSISTIAPTAPATQAQGLSEIAATKEAEAHAKTHTKPKRPSRLDMSRLFPQIKGDVEKTFSPSQLVPSPAPLTGKSDYFSSATPGIGKGSRWGLRSKKSKESIKTAISPSSTPRLAGTDKFDSPKLNVRRPPRGIQHWFDGIDMDDEKDEAVETEPDFDQFQSFDHLQKHLTKFSGNATAANRDAPRLIWRNSKFNSNGNMAQPSNTIRQSHIKPSVRTGEGIPGSPRAGSMSNTNLQKQSVLSLSSDDDEPDTHTPRAQSTYKMDKGEKNVRVSSGSDSVNTSIKNTRPRHPPSRNASDSPRHSGITSGSILIAPPSIHLEDYSAMPQKGRSRKISHQSDLSRSPSIQEVGEPTPMSDNSSGLFDSHASTPTQPASPTTTITTVSTEPLRYKEPSRMMEVSKEEEALLAMMRRKRAAMVKTSFTEGYKRAMAEEQALLQQEAADRKRHALRAIQMRQREKQIATISQTRPQPPQTSSPTEPFNNAKLTTLRGPADNLSPRPQTDFQTKLRSPSHTSAQAPHIASRPTSTTSSIYSQPHASSDTNPDFSSPPLNSVPIASPFLHLFPTPGASVVSPSANLSPFDSIMERSDSTPSATTLDSPLTPDQSEQLPLRTQPPPRHDRAPSTTTTVPGSRTTSSACSEVLPICAPSPGPVEKRAEQKMARVSSVGSVGSVQSFDSAGADVLAAWGALGGWRRDERVRMARF